MSIPPLLFLIYGISSPLYYTALKGKLSNERGFWSVWVSSPFLISYFFSTIIYIIALSVINIIYIIFLPKLFNYVKNGLLLISIGILWEIIYKLL
ncbi:hypothetical protein CM19_05685 [Candidatus Acidianus copahuensis]|uniref:Uncharacterized protein n=1 Tax=Candidatus Acidianus copahuensis TaxID=1160895 RepID=A0A031LPU5_9CREN|nr:hypothetical protein [Candidatus Acidianus copahuensis]EZQ07107.1 hypothetical protein CM19_05685 [Candidatus Acidianus copahuensis]